MHRLWSFFPGVPSLKKHLLQARARFMVEASWSVLQSYSQFSQNRGFGTHMKTVVQHRLCAVSQSRVPVLLSSAPAGPVCSPRVCSQMSLLFFKCLIIKRPGQRACGRASRSGRVMHACLAPSCRGRAVWRWGVFRFSGGTAFFLVSIVGRWAMCCLMPSGPGVGGRRFCLF